MSDVDPTRRGPFHASLPGGAPPPGADGDGDPGSPWVGPGGGDPTPEEPVGSAWPQTWPAAPPPTYAAADWGLPPMPPSPPPRTGLLPTLPPAPPEVRWGIGDFFYGVLVWLGSSIVVTVVLLLTGVLDVDTTSGEVGEMGLAALGASMAAGWIGLIGWPVIATSFKGLHSLSKDFGLAITVGDVGWGILAGVAALAVSVVGGLMWMAISDADQPSNGDFLPTSDPTFGTAVVLLLLVAVVTPIAEELFFRGLFLRALTKRWNTLVGMSVSSLVFGVFHITAFSLSGLFIILVTAGYGFVLAVVTVFRNFRIGPAIVAHMVINGTAVLGALAVAR